MQSTNDFQYCWYHGITDFTQPKAICFCSLATRKMYSMGKDNNGQRMISPWMSYEAYLVSDVNKNGHAILSVSRLEQAIIPAIINNISLVGCHNFTLWIRLPCGCSDWHTNWPHWYQVTRFVHESYVVCIFTERQDHFLCDTNNNRYTVMPKSSHSGPGVGFTKAPFVIFSASTNFDPAKVPVRSQKVFNSLRYLADTKHTFTWMRTRVFRVFKDLLFWCIPWSIINEKWYCDRWGTKPLPNTMMIKFHYDLSRH